MSLTSYRAAPPRVNGMSGRDANASDEAEAYDPHGQTKEWVPRETNVDGSPAAMPGDDLLFQHLSASTIGAVWFHGRVRDGIGWGTDAIATKQ